ncbi:MAG: hypothetical protein QF535_01530 [Anaerolineales bacterium]|jgi:hypothetical protein|nr:hypothetical protein [Anaerolineales bacterium]|tara:strand:- start:985 stop:1842 length:858 start_codon:yes stop_codon:yes gene_type:complete
MMKKIYPTIIIMILAATIIPLFTPTAVAQEATATLQIQNCDTGCILTLAVTSPTSVFEFQVSIKVSNTITLDTSQTTFTGFMAGASLLALEGSALDEYRWFNLQSQGGTVGTLSVPISNPETGDSISLDKVDLLNADGTRIEVVTQGISGILTTTVITTSTSTVTLLSTNTATATVTSTTTMITTSTTVSTATTTTTVSSAQTTITQTVSSTSTARTTTTTTETSAQTTSTITTTQTNTETIEEGSSVGIYAIVFAIIGIAILGLAVLRQQREDLFTRLREKLPF